MSLQEVNTSESDTGKR